MDNFNMTSMLIGIIACIIYVCIQFRGRIIKAKKGYEMESIDKMIIRSIIISAVILAFSYKLSMYKGIPFALIIVAIVVLVYGFITSKTVLGRHFYAVGGNEKAAKLSGINTSKVYFIAYTNMGFLAALAGMMTIARLTSAQPTYGQNYEMDAIGSCFIGGASAYGGTGKVSGVIIGALLMGVINIGMSIMGVGADIQRVVKGIVLLGAVAFDVITKKRKD
jgi:putative multiple sugar transport system permease protein